MHKEKMEFSLMMADDALRQHFDDRRDGCCTFAQIQKTCRNLLSVDNVRRVYARLLKMELNQRAVQAAIQSLPEEKQRYLRLKYKQEKGGIALSLALHVSVAQLNLWHRSILEHVAQFMLYQLRVEDIFFYKKIVGMVQLLSETLACFSRMEPDGVVITEAWLAAITTRHADYRMLLNSIEELLHREHGTLHERIVAAKFAHPYEPSCLIARKCHVDDAVVSRHLRQFTDAMAEYITS